jgi:hypothetical protein
MDAATDGRREGRKRACSRKEGDNKKENNRRKGKIIHKRTSFEQHGANEDSTEHGEARQKKKNEKVRQTLASTAI